MDGREADDEEYVIPPLISPRSGNFSLSGRLFMSVPMVSSFSADSSPEALLVLPKVSAGPHPLLEWGDSLHKKATNQTEYRPGGVGPDHHEEVL